MSQRENLEVVRAFTEAYNSGDVDRIEVLCSDKCEIVGIRATLEETGYVGALAVRRWWADAVEIWSERRFDIREMRAEDAHTVIVRAMWHGRGRASGAEVERQLGFRFRLEGGRIASFRTFTHPEAAGWAHG